MAGEGGERVADSRPILDAELFAVGSEVTAGETVDTNSAELARGLGMLGIRVRRISAVPDDHDLVASAVRDALGRADLVMSTGGLGPTPDDLTREAIAAVAGEDPTPDPELVAWLRALWERRSMPFPESNMKQAWLIPSATAIPNPNGTAPGWWVDRPDGRVIIALPGPPREMQPMWADAVVPRLRARGAGAAVVTRTLRLTGIGESQVAERLGVDLLRAVNPVVATYARADAIDVRIEARSREAVDGTRAATADEVADAAEGAVLAAVGEHVWARGTTTWADAIEAELRRRGWTLAFVEAGTAGTLCALLGTCPGLERAVVVSTLDGASDELLEQAREVRGDASIGVAVRARLRGDDTGVTIAVVTPEDEHTERRVAFMGGFQGRSRAALLAADVLLRALRGQPVAAPGSR